MAETKSKVKEKKEAPLWMAIVNGIFTVRDIANNYTYEAIRDNFFMINQTMAKKYPVEAQAFNKSNVNPVSAVRYWNSKLFGTSVRVPSWVYASVAKPKDSSKKVSYKKYLREYCLRYELDYKDVLMDYYLYPDIIEGRLKEYKEMLDELESKMYEMKKMQKN